VPKYKQVSVTEMHYSWKSWRWGHNRNVTESGNNLDTYWPSEKKIALNKSCAGKEKERTSKKGEYKVVFKNRKGEIYSYNPQTEIEFKQFLINSQHRIRVSIAGGVEIVRDHK
jgi:hypothetical protein